MAKVEIYSKDYCPYCQQAKNLFDEKGVEYTEYDVTSDEAKQKEMMERSEGNLLTVPQIYINDELVGGYTDLQALDDEGKLDEMLAAEAA